MSKPGKEEYFILWAGHIGHGWGMRAMGLAGVPLVLAGFSLPIDKSRDSLVLQNPNLTLVKSTSTETGSSFPPQIF